MADNAQIVVWTLNSASQGKIRLKGMKSHQVKDGGKVEPTNEVGNPVPAGFKITPGAKTISFEFYLKKGKPVPDWSALVLSRELVTLTKQIEEGVRVQYLPAMVSTYDPQGDNEGENMASVEIVALQEKPL